MVGMLLLKKVKIQCQIDRQSLNRPPEEKASVLVANPDNGWLNGCCVNDGED
uniref:Uncharacterized protein n=1 Tax=Arundo donax TaxID=35708 RepID=A0A0A9DRQ8_ARUDO